MKKFRLINVFIAFSLVLSLFSFLSLPKSTYAATVYKSIEINKSNNWLYLYENGVAVKKYRVATGRETSLTPVGTFPIVVKIVNPGWRNPKTGENVPGGSEKNPLGPRWNGLSVNGDNGRSYGIHGTNQPSSIGTNASSGCVRMNSEQVKDLYSRIYEGVPVWIHNTTESNVNPKVGGELKGRKWKGDSSVGLKAASGTVKTTNSTTLWTGPSTGSFKIQSVSKNLTLTRIGTSGSWTKVKLSNGKTGFIYNGDLNVGLKFDNINGYVIQTVDKANVRSGPSTSSSVITNKTKINDKYTVNADNGEWYRINYKGKTAYLSHQVAKRWSVTVTASRANIRSGPSLNSKVVETVSGGTVLSKIGVDKDFHVIYRSNGTKAYIHTTVAK